MTSNVGAKIIETESGLTSKKSTTNRLNSNSKFLSSVSDPVIDPNLFERISSLVNEELKKYFRPEFLNRLDEIIVFNHLTRKDITRIADIMIQDLIDRMAEKDVILEVRDKVKSVLVEEGFDPLYGARPLRRAVMRLLEDNLANHFLEKTLYPNTKLIVNADINNNVTVEVDYMLVDSHFLKEEK